MAVLLEALTEERRYLRIQPADNAVNPATIQRSITDLHRTVRGGGAYPTYEVLIAAVGDGDDAGTRSLSWFVGVDPRSSADALDATRRTLTACLPPSYDVVETTASYADLLELPIEDDPLSADDSIPEPDPALTAEVASDLPTTTEPVGASALEGDDADAHARPLDDADDTASAGEASATRGNLDATAVASGLTSAREAVAEQVSHPDPEPAEPTLPEWEAAGVEYFGVGRRPDDWQLPLPEMAAFGGDAGRPAWPLASVCDALAEGDAPALVQVLVEPKPDWGVDRDGRIDALQRGVDLTRHNFYNGIVDTITEALGGDASRSQPGPRSPTRAGSRTSSHSPRDRSGADTGRRQGVGPGDRPTRTDTHSRPDPTENTAPAVDPSTARRSSDARRIEALQTATTKRTFTVNARVIALEREADAEAADATLRPLRDAFTELDADDYRVRGRLYPYGSLAATRLFERVLTRDFEGEPRQRRHTLPLVPNASRAIVTDPATVGAFCLTGSAALASPARRALATTPPEKTGLELPPGLVLDRYLDVDGMPVGHPKTADREPMDATLTLPPAVHTKHMAILSSTGGGKSILGQGMAVGGHGATEGATIVLDSKGDGAPDALLRTHFARHGDLQDVYYFDCGDLLPAFSVLSIEPQLEAGIGRAKAVEHVANRYVDLLAAYMGRENFHSADAAVDVIKALVKALFDPIHGSDTITQYRILEACKHMRRTGEPPTVSDPYLRESIRTTIDNSDQTFDNIMTAAARRIQKASNDARLRLLFEDPEQYGTAFDFLEHLDEQCLIVIDTSDYRQNPRRLLTIVIVSQLWTALQRRLKARDVHGDPPIVNLFIEEAADAATADVLTELLSQGRSFGVGITLMLQFLQQVRDTNPRLHDEIVNDIGTHITGPINDPGDLVHAYATADLDREEVATRISNLARGDWLVRPGMPHGEERPRPFVCGSRALPPGHPEGDDPLSDREETTYQAERTLLETRMYRHYGIDISEYTVTPGEGDVDVTTPTPGGQADSEAVPDDHKLRTPVPYTERLPDGVTYRDEAPYPLVCEACETRHPSTIEGMRRAITCCHDLAAVDRDDVPVMSLGMSLTAAERQVSDYNDAQLRFLAVVYNAHQRHYDPDLEFDLVHDSMVRLQEYVGADTDDVVELREDGLLKRDCTHPHRLYTVTPEGRAELKVAHREGVAHGDGKGDLSESSLHVAMIEVGCRCLRIWFVETPDSPGVEVRRYYELEDGRRLDAVVLDADGDVVAAMEAERSNNDIGEAVPADFDKMADCDPEHAIWVVKNRAGAHDVLQALNDPVDSEPRVEKTYSENMRPRDFSIDTPGMTDVYTFQNCRDELDDA